MSNNAHNVFDFTRHREREQNPEKKKIYELFTEIEQKINLATEFYQGDEAVDDSRTATIESMRYYLKKDKHVIHRASKTHQNIGRFLPGGKVERKVILFNISDFGYSTEYSHIPIQWTYSVSPTSKGKVFNGDSELNILTQDEAGRPILPSFGESSSHRFESHISKTDMMALAKALKRFSKHIDASKTFNRDVRMGRKSGRLRALGKVEKRDPARLVSERLGLTSMYLIADFTHHFRLKVGDNYHPVNLNDVISRRLGIESEGYQPIGEEGPLDLLSIEATQVRIGHRTFDCKRLPDNCRLIDGEQNEVQLKVRDAFGVGDMYRINYNRVTQMLHLVHMSMEDEQQPDTICVTFVLRFGKESFKID